MSHNEITEDSLYKSKPNSKQEISILHMWCKHFGEMPPFSRNLSKGFTDNALEKIRSGEVHVATLKNGPLIGMCTICPPHHDDLVQKYAIQHNCNHYLAALIIDVPYRRQGHAQDLFLHALRGKNGEIVLTTPEIDVAAISLYQKIGMQIIAEFDQTEQDFDSGEDFNLHRVVMTGSVAEMKNELILITNGQRNTYLEEGEEMRKMVRVA